MPPVIGRKEKGSPADVEAPQNPEGAGIEDTIRRFVLSDRYCQAAAVGLMDYWKTKPDPHFEAVRYDAGQKLFLVTHKMDGQFSMTPEKFFTLVAKRAVQILSEGVGSKIKSLLEA